MRAVIFGAGNIGRGFLGLLLRNAGIEVTFVDLDERKVRLLQERRAYPVYLVSKDGIDRRQVTGVSAIALNDTVAVRNVVESANLVLTAVGKDALSQLAPALAEGLLQRARRGHKTVVTVIACENVQDNTQHLHNLLRHQFHDDAVRAEVDAVAVYPNCVVDRIVPNSLPAEEQDPLAVCVEQYFQFAVDAEVLQSGFPDIPGVELTPGLEVVLEQKLCTLNAAHAIIAYYGYLRGHRYVHEASVDEVIRELVEGLLNEVEALLIGRHATLTAEGQRTYAKGVLSRFENPYLRDEITRVARQPLRKLAPDDRLVRPARLLSGQGRVPSYLATGIAAALHYDFGGDTQAQELVHQLRQEGIVRVLAKVANIPPESDLGRMVAASYRFRSL